MANEEKCCGNCCWFKHEDLDGFGICMKDYPDAMPFCGDECKGGQFVSTEQMRHHMAVLLQANRYRRDRHVPSIYMMPDPKELGEAIDFSVEYMNVFSLL